MDTREKTRSANQRKRTAPVGTKREPRKAATKVRKSEPPKQPQPEEIYIQPGPFNTMRFMLRLVTVIAVVFALIFGMSIFFKVENVTVAGTNKYTRWEVWEASGILKEENLLGISAAKISTRIKEKLPYVSTVRIGIKLPDTVKIEIEELDVVYSVEAENGTWWLIRSDGVVVEKTNAAEAEQHTKLMGVKIEKPSVGKVAKAAQEVPQETTEEEQSAPAVKDQSTQRLQTAISIFQYLEERGIIGEAASVNVSDMSQLEIWYKDRFQILLGDSTQLLYKVKLAQVAIDEHMQSYDSGVLDVSLTIQPDEEKEYQVIYTPFD